MKITGINDQKILDKLEEISNESCEGNLWVDIFIHDGLINTGKIRFGYLINNKKYIALIIEEGIWLQATDKILDELKKQLKIGYKLTIEDIKNKESYDNRSDKVTVQTNKR